MTKSYKTSYTLPELAESRYRLMQQGFLNKSEIRQFVPCGKRRAAQIFDDIERSIKREGIENLQGNIIKVERVMKYLGLTEKKVVDLYEKECIKKG